MKKSKPFLLNTVAAMCATLLLASAAAASTVTLAPLVTGNAPGGSSAGGLSGTWYQLDGNASFSTAPYTDTNGRTDQIQNFGWGTGIWSTHDIAAIAAGQNPHVVATATSVGAVSYANNIYNNTVTSGAYGVWGEDDVRALAPVVGGANGCRATDTAGCGAEENYAAVFSGYLYVGVAGAYDFGVFADDGFSFQLTGLDGSVGMEQDFVAGRNLYEMLAMNSIDGLFLEQGYYGIQMLHFNRQEAGVIELGWKGPSASAWALIDSDALYNEVPEPASLVLVGVALLGLCNVRGRRAVAARVSA